MIGFEKLAVSQIKSMCWALAKKIIKERRLRRGEEVVCLQSIKTSDEQTESIYSHVFVQNDDHDTSDEDDEASKPPKKFKSMVEIMKNSQRVEIEEAAQTIETCHHAHEEPHLWWSVW